MLLNLNGEYQVQGGASGAFEFQLQPGRCGQPPWQTGAGAPISRAPVPAPPGKSDRST